jgi:BirA family transcriptional regulator, biotin operon repressor / biotin---[acetyl-CoA-carboxylase] ligase
MSSVILAPVKKYATIDSTNQEARRLFENGERGPLWIVSKEQTAGRGRLGRTWVSVEGNLYCTLLLPTTASTEQLYQLTPIAACAVFDVITSMTRQNNWCIKWPNDVLLNGGKVAGILCEVVSTNPSVVAIGIGINVASAPDGMPYKTNFLCSAAAKATPTRVLNALKKRLDFWLEKWEHGATFARVAHAYSGRIPTGYMAEINTGEKTYTGLVAGVDIETCGIVLNIDGKYQKFLAGDLTLRPKVLPSA